MFLFLFFFVEKSSNVTILAVLVHETVVIGKKVNISFKECEIKVGTLVHTSIQLPQFLPRLKS